MGRKGTPRPEAQPTALALKTDSIEVFVAVMTELVSIGRVF